jgi:hypothetical protein
MFSTVYHKKAFVLKIPPRPPFPKGDNKDDSHIFMKLLRTHLPEDPKYQGGEESPYNKGTILARLAAQQILLSPAK